MALTETLKNTFLFIGIVVAMIYGIIGAEVVFKLFVQIMDEIRDRKKKARIWED